MGVLGAFGRKFANFICLLPLFLVLSLLYSLQFVQFPTSTKQTQIFDFTGTSRKCVCGSLGVKNRHHIIQRVTYEHMSEVQSTSMMSAFSFPCLINVEDRSELVFKKETLSCSSIVVLHHVVSTRMVELRRTLRRRRCRLQWFDHE